MIKIIQRNSLSDCIDGILQKHLSLITEYKKNNQGFYKKKFIPKKGGGLRKIESPSNKTLKQILDDIYGCFVAAGIYFPECVNGFVEKRSIVTNASIHLGAELVINIDLKNFFNTIKKGKIIPVLIKHPFNFSIQLATLLAETVTKNDYLPQGSPLSPIFSNIVANKLDTNLSEYCIRKDIRYSRYADDMTFSLTKGRIEDEEILKIRQIILDNGFTINEKKFKIKRRPKRLMVTGVKINDRLNVKRTYLKNVKAILHQWENGYSKKSKINSNSLRGKIEFIGMVRGKDDYIYQTYLNKFYHLKDRDEKTTRQQANNSNELIDDEFMNLIS